MHLLFAHHTTGRGQDWLASDSGGWIGPNFHLWFLYYLLLCCGPLALVLAMGHRVPGRLLGLVRCEPCAGSSSVGG